MKKRLIVFCCLAGLLALLPGSLVLAVSDISEAIYYGVIRASNNSTAAQNVSANVSIDTANWILAGTVNSTATNIAVRSNTGADTAFMPGQGGNPWIVWFDSVPADSTIDATLYTNASDGKIRYFPGTGGMTTADNDTSLELGDNFTIEQKGYIDTTAGSSKNLVYKAGALKIFNPSSGNVTAQIYGNTTPTGHTDPDSGWTNETNAYDDNTGTYASSGTITGAGWSYFLQLSHSALTTEFIRYWSGKSGTGDITQVDINAYYGSAWHDVYEDAVTHGSWQTVSLASAQSVSAIRIRFYNTGFVETAYLYELDYGVVASSVSVASIASGEHTITTSLNSDNFSLQVDSGTPSYTSFADSVPNTSTGWTFLQNDVMPYMEYQKIWIGGALRQHIIWQYDSYFYDQSGNGNTATPTFRTTGSNAYVSASLINFTPVQLSQVTDDTAGDWPEMMTEAPDEPSVTYTEEERPGIFFEPLVHTFWALSEIPDCFFWYGFAFFFILSGGMLTYRFFAEKSFQALFIKVIVQGGLLIFFALPGLNIYGFYVVLYYIFFAFGILVLVKDYGW